MLKASEKAEVARMLSRFFKTYQSARSIEPEAQVYFVEDVAEYSFEAIERTVTAFRRGEYPERNNGFAPSVAEFVAAVRERQEKLDFQSIVDRTEFIEVDTPLWRAICEQRGRSMPQVDRKGITGWYVPKDEVAGVPQLLVLKYHPDRFRQIDPAALEASQRHQIRSMR